jgi:hypothetical protein
VQGQVVVGALELDGGVRAERLHIVALLFYFYRY